MGPVLVGCVSHLIELSRQVQDCVPVQFHLVGPLPKDAATPPRQEKKTFQVVDLETSRQLLQVEALTDRDFQADLQGIQGGCNRPTVASTREKRFRVSQPILP